MEYEELISKVLEKQPLIRHLWSRLGSEVTVETTSTRIRGVLRSIDLKWRWIEVDNTQMGKTFFINLLYVISIKTVGTEKVISEGRSK